MTDAAQLREAFTKRNIAEERAELLFNYYDPLTVALNRGRGAWRRGIGTCQSLTGAPMASAAPWAEESSN